MVSIYKILYIILPTNRFLYLRRFSESPLCSFCNIHEETLLLLFRHRNLICEFLFFSFKRHLIFVWIVYVCMRLSSISINYMYSIEYKSENMFITIICYEYVCKCNVYKKKYKKVNNSQTILYSPFSNICTFIRVDK